MSRDDPDETPMSGHVIVCGMGMIGYRVVELLERLGEQVVVITMDARAERLQMAKALGVRVRIGDARNDRLLVEAGLATARAVIAATDHDAVNVEVALDARRARPDIPVIIRLFDQDLARQLETTLDLHRALGMSALAAPSFAAAAMGDAILATLTLDGASFVVGRQAASHEILAEASTVAAAVRELRLQTLALERAGEGCIALPEPEEALRTNDRLTLFGPKERWERLFGSVVAAPRRSGRQKGRWRGGLRRLASHAARLWREGPLALRTVFLSLCLLLPLTVFLFRHFLHLTLTDAIFYTIINLHGNVGTTTAGPEIKLYEAMLLVLGSVTVATLYSMVTDYVVGSRLRKLLGGRPMPAHGHVVVVGMGTVGYRVLLDLVDMGVPVVAVETDANAPFLTAVRNLAAVVVGDARMSVTLERAGLARARAVVAATADDAVNLGIGLAARRLSPGIRTVVRVFDADFARKVERDLGMDAALGASRIAAPTFAASALFPDVAKAFIVQDRLFVLQSRRADAEWAGRTPSSLWAESEVRILVRGGELVTDSAGEDDPLALGEELLVVLSRRLAPPWSERPVPAGGRSGPP